MARSDGSLLWEHGVVSGAIESAPVPSATLVFAGGADGRVHAIDVETGKPSWEHDVLADKPPPPSAEFDEKHALNGGSERARLRTACTDAATLYQPIFDQSRVVAIDCATGKRRWSFQAGGWIYGEPTVTDNQVFVGSQDKMFYCLDKRTGAVVWKFATGSRIEAGCAVRNNSVFFGSCDKRFYCVGTNTGKLVWSYETEGVIYSSPLVSDDAVYFGSFDGYLYALDIATGALVWRIAPFEDSEVDSTPCTDGARLFFTTRPRGRSQGVSALVAVGDSDLKE